MIAETVNELCFLWPSYRMNNYSLEWMVQNEITMPKVWCDTRCIQAPKVRNYLTILAHTHKCLYAYGKFYVQKKIYFLISEGIVHYF